MMKSGARHDKKVNSHSVRMKKDIIEFLYEEGASTMHEVGNHMRRTSDWASRKLNEMKQAGDVGFRIHGGLRYWYITEEAIIAYERDNLQKNEQWQDSDLVRAA